MLPFLYIAICYFVLIKSIFYGKNNLHKFFPYNGLEHDISILKNEGNILLLGDFNARTTTNQAIILNNDSKPNPLWLEEELASIGRYKRRFKDR